MLKRWREYATIVAAAAKNLLGDKLEVVYVVGGVAEDRVSVFSDIDIVLVVKDPGIKSIDTIADVLVEAERLGLPFDAPIDLKMYTAKEFRLNKEKFYRRVIEIPVPK